jgi:group I intron endonuclease
MGIIYLWTNKNTNKHYVGQTINPEQRKASHICEAFTRGSDYYFHRSLRKHGLDAFTYEVLEEDVFPENLNDRENYYIDKYNSIWPNGYNQCRANSLDAAAIEKMSKTKKLQWQAMSDEDKLKWKQERASFTMRGRKQTINQKKAAAEANQKEWLVTYPNGIVVKITNLRQFCIDEGLGTNGQSNLVRGSYKGYKATKV